ncbi:MAG: hypothetical protein K5872_22280 [Rhizobiaceae bacterium]|nr:hypothetical protein [Rhizobiaceae bacterium]MCV0408949.1 hypothetical protein [Rhizobiaceae bacterium]
MPQSTSTVLLRGGLDLVTPPVAMDPGKCIAALNYEPEADGYRRIGGYERFDGRPRPSEAATDLEAEQRRLEIDEVDGIGEVRGVAIFKGDVYAFRDHETRGGAMWKASAVGWQGQTFGSYITFSSGTAEYVEGDVLVGGTSGATATINRVVLRSGSYSAGDAAGYVVINDPVAAFQSGETATSTSSGSATLSAEPQRVNLHPGGRYSFVEHNFYGARKSRRLYFANGAGTAFEYSGEWLAPILTGGVEGDLDVVTFILNRAGDNVVTRAGDFVIARGEYDRPRFVTEFRNHLFLSFDAGSVLHSGVAEPLDYRAIAGAAEIAFGSKVTGMLPGVSTALFILGESRVDFLAGNDSSDFQLLPLSSSAGALAYTPQIMNQTPIYLDDAGLRSVSSTSAFGDFRMGSISQMVEPLLRRKRREGILPTASIVMKRKDQYRLFFNDGTGLIVYFGRKNPEILPFKLPIVVTCACAGELTKGGGERYFVGATDGFVYELQAGNSFDGAEVPAFLRLAWNTIGAPRQQKRFHKATVEVDAEEDVEIGIAFDVDYRRNANAHGARADVDVDAGSPSLVDTDGGGAGTVQGYDDIDWTPSMQGLVEAYLDGIGTNLALTLISEHTTEAPHTFSSMTINFMPRKIVR